MPATAPGYYLLPCLLLLALVAWNPASAQDDDPHQVPLRELEKTFTGDLPEMRKRKRIRALVTYSRTDFFFDHGRARGIQVEFLQAYEKFINKGVKRATDQIHITYLPVTFDQLIPALRAGKGDIAAAFLTVTPEREKKVAFATGGKLKVRELVVTHKDTSGIESVQDLSGKSVYVLKDSSYVRHLEQLNLQLRRARKPPVRIVPADPNLLSEDILELVNAGVVPITIVDDYKARGWKKVLPDIRVHETVSIRDDNTVGWATRRQNPELGKSLDRFARKVGKGTLLGNMLFRRYYRDTRWIDNPVSREQRKRQERFIALFRKYGKRYGFDHLALMAQAYQESGLDNRKKSHRGAVGIMQLLPSTAADPHVNVKNIRQLENNIHAGTKYLAFLRDRYFNDPGISHKNRLAFTWAAYNTGPASLRKVRDKAKKMGLDPNVWFGNVELAAGRYIGKEPVQYVANIYKYYVAYKLADELADRKKKHRRTASAGTDRPG
ncbi:MAG TPA: lytic transglycosylase F [Gammaproteobacteria bacterium]|nr:lytic transglycosylase F [Gammaproteobacteria bacterium]